MLFGTRKTRKFSYIPSFYDKKNNREPDSRKSKIVFRRDKKYKKKKKPLLGILLLLLIALFIIQYLNNIRTPVPEDIELKKLEVIK